MLSALLSFSTYKRQVYSLIEMLPSSLQANADLARHVFQEIYFGLVQICFFLLSFSYLSPFCFQLLYVLFRF